MADAVLDWANSPLAVCNFRVVVAGVPMSFSRVSGLSIDYHVTTYRHGLSFKEGALKKRVRSGKPGTMTLEKGKVVMSDVLYLWLYGGLTLPVFILLCDGRDIPRLTWAIPQATPVRLSAPSFDADAAEIAIDALELRVEDALVAYAL